VGFNFIVEIDLEMDSKVYPTMTILARVNPPHSDMRLAHGAERVLHCASFDGVLEGSQSPVEVSLSKYLEDQHSVILFAQVGVNNVLHAECVPP
jgi:hypothetical protein